MSFVARIETLAAQDTPIRIVLQKRMISLDSGLFRKPIQSLRIQADFQKSSHSLQFAPLVGWTMTTIHVMGGKEKLQASPLQMPHRRGIRFYDHPLFDCNGAGGVKSVHPFDFNKTHSA